MSAHWARTRMDPRYTFPMGPQEPPVRVAYGQPSYAIAPGRTALAGIGQTVAMAGGKPIPRWVLWASIAGLVGVMGAIIYMLPDEDLV